MRKSWIAVTSVSAIAAVAMAVPAVRGLAMEPREEKSKACAALAADLQDSATGLQSDLVAVPPKLDAVGEVVNGLLGKVMSLIDLGCLPEPALPVAAPAADSVTDSVADSAADSLKREKQLPPLPTLPPTLVPLPSVSALPLPSVSALPLPSVSALPLPSVSALPPVGGALPTVPTCTDLTADLLDAVTSVLSAILSATLPDLTAGASAATNLLDTLTSLTENNCLPAAAPVKR